MPRSKSPKPRRRVERDEAVDSLDEIGAETSKEANGEAAPIRNNGENAGEVTLRSEEKESIVVVKEAESLEKQTGMQTSQKQVIVTEITNVTNGKDSSLASKRTVSWAKILTTETEVDLKEPVVVTPRPTASNSTPSLTSFMKWRWYDANGEGPITRFLRADDPTVALPTIRVAVMLLLGFLLSGSVVWLSEDEFFEGTTDHHHKQQGFDFPVHIAFKDVRCSISATMEDALHNVTGSIPPGKLTGILGQSGSGKTLLSYQLLGRGRKFCSHANTGQVFLNGRPRSLEAFLDRVGFVPQDDVLYGDLTVEETLQFSANWRLPRALSEAEKGEIVNETISILNLNRVRGSKVGTVQKRGISGGERRRVSIGMELVARPSVLIAVRIISRRQDPILNEPTTGLDGAGAYQLIKSLRSFVENRKGYVSVVVVLHQPSERTFDLLQHVILMARGTIVFSGHPQQAIHFLADCGFVYNKETDPQERSAAEFILDVLSGAENEALGVDGMAQLLQAKWTERFVKEQHWRRIEMEMSQFHQREREILKTLQDESNFLASVDASSPSLWMTFLQSFGFLEHCRDPSHQAELWCVVFLGTPFPVLPKPGLRKQLHVWFWQMVRITWRRGIALHLFVIHCLAFVVGFVRSFNQSWSRRPHANFVLSIVISLIGMLGAVFSDEVAPVQRAAASGMILAAHELAQLAHTLILGWFQCHWFAITYFSFIWLRSGVWCCKPFRFEKYYEFTHILHLHYLVSSGIGSCICAITGHDLQSSFILAIGALMHFHVFALFSPSKSQAEKDTKILFGKIDISPLVLFYAKWSFVRYSQEAMMLWEPDVDSDKVARNFTLRYFSWQEQNFIADLTWMFALWTLALSTRFALFAISNANAYNSAYDLPLFLVFLGKVLILHLTALIMMTLVHEFYTSWKDAKLNHLKECEAQKAEESAAW